MKKILIIGLLVSPSCWNIACSAPVTVVTPQGQVAYTADQIVVRVNELQNAAIQAEATKGLDTNTTRIIVKFCVAADTTLATTPTGWQTTVASAWKQTKANLPVITNPSVQLAISAMDTVLAAFGV